MAKNKHVPRQIAPRLASGEKRLNWGGRLPPDIKAGIWSLAMKENKSVSWMMEEIIIRFFGYRTPKYLERRTKVGVAKSRGKKRSSE